MAASIVLHEQPEPVADARRNAAAGGSKLPTSNRASNVQRERDKRTTIAYLVMEQLESIKTILGKRRAKRVA
jgi:hypothetical protein